MPQPRKKVPSDTEVALMRGDMDRMARDLNEIKGDLRVQFTNFVTQDQFKPIKTIVYGAVGVILMSFIGAVVALVITRQP